MLVISFFSLSVKKVFKHILWLKLCLFFLIPDDQQTQDILLLMANVMAIPPFHVRRLTGMVPKLFFGANSDRMSFTTSGDSSIVEGCRTGYVAHTALSSKRGMVRGLKRGATASCGRAGAAPMQPLLKQLLHFT